MSATSEPFPFAIVGFDLDGTLLDTLGDLAAAVNHALGLEGRPPLSEAEIRPMIGGGTRMMLRRGLDASGGGDEALLDRLLVTLIDYYSAHIDAHSRPFPGLVEALDALASMGVRLGVVTNKREELAVKLLTRLGMASRFDCIIGGDTMGPGKAKPHPAPIHEMIKRCGGGSAVFVGDSHFDIDAAKNAGISSVAVSFGFLNAPVEQLGADAVIDHYNHLTRALHTLAERTPA
jgi:phosphoglycolate phosphatase